MDRHRLNNALSDLYDLVSRLRGPGGCPWDAVQTDKTIKMYLLEEAYEVVDAVEKGIPAEVCGELGDLLFQILFLARLAEERGEFHIVEVMERIREKMILRHPHVFGETAVEGPEEVAENWARIKKTEKPSPEPLWAVLQRLPAHLPALLKTHRLCERAAREGLCPSEPKAVQTLIQERFESLRKALSSQDRDGVAEVIGSLLFGLSDLARLWGMNGEDLLRAANDRFVQDIRASEQGYDGDHDSGDGTPGDMG